MTCLLIYNNIKSLDPVLNILPSQVSVTAQLLKTFGKLAHQLPCAKSSAGSGSDVPQGN